MPKHSEFAIKWQEEKLALAREFANHNEWFKDHFITSLEKDFKGYGELTDKQMHALNNVIEKCRMEEWAEKEGYEA